MRRFQYFLLFMSAAFALFSAPGHAGDTTRSIKSFFQSNLQPSDPVASASHGGCRITSAREPDSLFTTWDYQDATLELFFQDGTCLGKVIYGLALYTADIPRDISPDRFVSTVNGFHYSAKQAAGWMSTLGSRAFEYFPEEQLLVLELIRSGTVVISERGYVPGQGRRHVLGISQGRKRSAALNLRHERLHIQWDEDESFKLAWQAKWAALDAVQREAFRNKLQKQGYTAVEDIYLAEEWTVRQCELCETNGPGCDCSEHK